MDNHELQTAVGEIKRIDEERLALNAEKQKIRKSLKAEGVNLKGFDLAVKMSKLDSDERQEMDNNYVEVRRRDRHSDPERSVHAIGGGLTRLRRSGRAVAVLHPQAAREVKK